VCGCRLGVTGCGWCSECVCDFRCACGYYIYGPGNGVARTTMCMTSVTTGGIRLWGSNDVAGDATMYVNIGMTRCWVYDWGVTGV